MLALTIIRSRFNLMIFTDGLEIQIVTTDPRVRLEDPIEIVGIDDSSSSTIDRSSQPNSDSSSVANIGAGSTDPIGFIPQSGFSRVAWGQN